MTLEDIRTEGKSGELGNIPTAVVTVNQRTKAYRLPTVQEIVSADKANEGLESVFADIPIGLPNEPTPMGGGQGAARAFSVQGYGLVRWRDLFSVRQLLALGVLVTQTRSPQSLMDKEGYDIEWSTALRSYSACIISRTADYMTNLCVWEPGAEEVKHLYMRWALPITWDFAEANPLASAERFFIGGVNSAWRVLSNLHKDPWLDTVAPRILNLSAIKDGNGEYDLIVTDPPYYDAIPYADLMDFFYIWIRRILQDTSIEYTDTFMPTLAPKWDSDSNDGELIDDDSRHGGDIELSKQTYEDGMFRAFRNCAKKLSSNGVMVVVFANKKPNAWETLVSAVIRAGFFVNGSWPIASEMPGGLRNLRRASLSSSVWIVCKKRPIAARPGWDNKVIGEMRANIAERLHEYWDAGIRGPDFVWAATGPALEAYSKHPIVKKANTPGEVMLVGEFLSHVRRMVVDFVVGQVLTGEKEGSDMAAADRMDAPTAYYLLHRHDFGLEEAPSGACILYATACGLSDRELETAWNLVSHKGAAKQAKNDGDEPDPDDDTEPEENGKSGSKIKLKTWVQRKRGTMGFEAPSGRPIPLIDRVHRLMHLWRAGDVHKVDEYLDDNGLRRQELFKRLVQSLIELSNGGSDERSIMESLSNHIQAKGAVLDKQMQLPHGDGDIEY